MLLKAAAVITKSPLSRPPPTPSHLRQDPKQRTIMEMFQRSFTEDDDMDEAALLEAANDWGDDCDLPGNSSSASATRA